MAALFCDGFDHYTASADIVAKWTTLGNQTAISTTGGRRSGGALQITNIFAGRTRVTLTAPAPSGATAILGAAIKWPGGATQFMGVSLASTTQFCVQYNSNGTLTVYRGTATALGSTVLALQQNVFAYIELKVLIHASTGTVELRVNGMNWPLGGSSILTGQNTLGTGTATFDEFWLTGAEGTYFDDLYVLDGSGSNNNDFLGDSRVDVILPNAAGNSSQFTRSTGANQWATIDETAPNSDTDYNETVTATNRDMLNFPNAPVTGAAIRFVQALAYVKKTDAGAAGMKLSTRISSTDYDGTEFGLTTVYTYIRQIWGINPGTAVAWVDTDINAAEFGYVKST